MIIARLDPTTTHELEFDLEIHGTQEQPTDARFIIEAPEDEDRLQDAFSVICKVYRGEKSLKVVIPRLVKLFRGGIYRSKLEIVMENRLFVPLSEEIEIVEPMEIVVKEHKVLPEKKKEIVKPAISVNLKTPMDSIVEKVLEEVVKPEPVKPIKKFDPEKIEIDDTWKKEGFKKIGNPFK